MTDSFTRLLVVAYATDITFGIWAPRIVLRPTCIQRRQELRRAFGFGGVLEHWPTNQGVKPLPYPWVKAKKPRVMTVLTGWSSKIV